MTASRRCSTRSPAAASKSHKAGSRRRRSRPSASGERSSSATPAGSHTTCTRSRGRSSFTAPSARSPPTTGAPPATPPAATPSPRLGSGRDRHPITLNEIPVPDGQAIIDVELKTFTEIKPDLSLELRIDTLKLTFDLLVELDLTARPSYNRDKFLAYDAFLCGWSLAHPRYRAQGTRPVVVFVCPDAHAALACAREADAALTGRIGVMGTQAEHWYYAGRDHMFFAVEADMHHHDALRARAASATARTARAAHRPARARDHPRRAAPRQARESMSIGSQPDPSFAPQHQAARRAMFIPAPPCRSCNPITAPRASTPSGSAGPSATAPSTRRENHAAAPDRKQQPAARAIHRQPRARIWATARARPGRRQWRPASRRQGCGQSNIRPGKQAFRRSLATRLSPKAGRARRRPARCAIPMSMPAWPGAACRVSGGRRRARIWAIARAALAEVVGVARRPSPTVRTPQVGHRRGDRRCSVSSQAAAGLGWGRASTRRARLPLAREARVRWAARRHCRRSSKR